MQVPQRPAFGEDLCIDDADREYLDGLPELERETILSSRYEDMQVYKEAMRIYEKHLSDTSAPPAKRARRRDSPVRESRAPEPVGIPRTSEKIDLSSLVARAEPLRVDVVPAQAAVQPVSVPAPASSESDFRSICLSRDKATALFSSLAPAVMVDCALRLPWPQSGGYALGFVVRVQTEDRKFLVKISGKQVTVPLMSVSNSPPSDKEISDSVQDFDSGRAKRKALEISLALEQRQPLDMRQVNPTLEMARLRDELEIAKAKLATVGNSSESESIKTQMVRLQREIEEVRKVAEEQRKRKLENTRNNVVPTRSREEISRAIKTNNEEISGTTLNPFKRRECAPTVMWDIGKNKKFPTTLPSTKAVSDQKQQPSRSLSPDRQPRKEKFSVLKDFESLDLLADLDLKRTLDRLEKTKISDMRSHEHQLACQRAFPTDLRPLWAKLKISGNQEVMTLDEWRARVQEAQTSL